MPANDRTSVGSGRGDWQTPYSLYAALCSRYRFDFDAFADHDNALCGQYATADGTWQKSVIDKVPVRMSTLDGLLTSWAERRVFLNPPYSRGFLDRVADKMIDERNNAQVIVGLLPANTDTKWFHALRDVADITFLPRRVKFVDPDTGREGGSPPGGSMIVVMKNDWTW